MLTALSMQSRTGSLNPALIADIAQISAPQPLLAGVQSNMYNPTLSKDGNQLMFSHTDYSNLRIYNFTDNVTTPVAATRTQAFARATDTGAISVRCQGSTLVLTHNGTERRLHPVECRAGYCWASLSPNGKKIVFLAAGVGLVICDLQGNVLSRPGNFEAPVWYGDDHLVVQNTTDDGHQIHSSQIVLLKADGSALQPLTKPESMSMSPTASFDAGRIVYSTIDGRLYLLNVKLN